MKCQIVDEIAFSLSKMKRGINKVLPLSNVDPNIMKERRILRFEFSGIPFRIKHVDTFSG
jgi:hypothetical protein